MFQSGILHDKFHRIKYSKGIDMVNEVCPKCGASLECLGGCSAHENNWYCSNEEGCGWQAWDRSKQVKIRKEHHIWCNYYNSGPAEDCIMCKGFNERYPIDGQSGEELLGKYFPDTIIRPMIKEG